MSQIPQHQLIINALRPALEHPVESKVNADGSVTAWIPVERRNVKWAEITLAQHMNAQVAQWMDEMRQRIEQEQQQPQREPEESRRKRRRREPP